jgi:hypothetical protein
VNEQTCGFLDLTDALLGVGDILALKKKTAAHEIADRLLAEYQGRVRSFLHTAPR